MIIDHKVIHEFPEGEKVVGITQCQGIVFVATEWCIYKIVNDEVIPLKIILDKENA